MFETTSDLFGQYYSQMEPDPSFNRNLALEVKERLRQLDWLLSEIRDRENVAETFRKRSGTALKDHFEKHLAAGGSPNSLPTLAADDESQRDAQHLADAIFQARLLTESFYYFAGRLRSVLRKLPGLESFEAVGVRNVRNHLIEHSEHSGVLSQSFALGGARGPAI